MKTILFILLSFCLAGEMEVEGDLTVTEGVTAASFAGNGGGLTGIGMKPERIYQYKREYDTEFSITVPEDKIWMVEAVSNGNNLGAYLDGIYIMVYHGEGLLALPGQTLSHYSPSTGSAIIQIYEYSFSSSGTSQGMIYVEP